MPRSSTKTKTQPAQTHSCEFCKRSFHDERNLINHSCEKKRRWFTRENPAARLAFMSWARFYELNSRLTKSTAKKKSFREFIDSRYYTAFIKFGHYLIEVDVVDPAKYVDYVIKNNLPLDKWANDFVYEQYTADLIKSESPEDALSRNIEMIKKWSDQNNTNWNDFFRLIGPGQAVLWLKSGRISPWVFYNAESVDDLLSKCSPEQLQLIKEYANPGKWKIRFNQHQSTTEWIRQTLKEAGL